MNLKSKALYFLARREHSYLELFTKLKKYSADEAAITLTLDEFKELGYLSDERFIQAYLESNAAKYGRLKIKHTLNQKTGDSKLVEQVLDAAAIDELENARKLWQKKFGIKAIDKVQLARQIRFLLSKGFSYSIIKQVVNLTNIDDDECED